MQYRVILYNRTTERWGGSVKVPGRHVKKVLELAGVKDPRELGEIELAPKQLDDIAALLKFRADLSRFYYHLEPIEDALRA